MGNEKLRTLPRSGLVQRIKSFCVAEPTQMLRWTKPRGIPFGVLMMDGSTLPANKDGMGHSCASV